MATWTAANMYFFPPQILSRNCGLVFCGTCSEKRLPLPEEQLYDPVRVCLACFEKLVTLQERENEKTVNEGTIK